MDTSFVAAFITTAFRILDRPTIRPEFVERLFCAATQGPVPADEPGSTS
jgi:hypothetical protein